MSRFHLHFKHFKPETIEAARELFDSRPWQMSDADDKQAAGQRFVNKVCENYEVPAATLVLGVDAGGALGYQPSIVETDALGAPLSVQQPIVALPEWSILTLFHLVRVHMLAQGISPQGEMDPYGWSCSLFYTIKPVMFRARAREGRVIGVTVKDTFSSETWTRLVSAGVASNDTGLLTAPMTVVNSVLNGVSDISLQAFLDDNLPDSEETDQEPEAQQENDGLDTVNRDGLRRLAAEHNVEGRGRMTRDELLSALRAAGVRA